MYEIGSDHQKIGPTTRIDNATTASTAEAAATTAVSIKDSNTRSSETCDT